MNTIEVVLVASSVINVLLLLLVFISYSHINTMRMHISQLHSGMATALNKLMGMEQVLSKLATGFADFVNMTGELIEKIDGNSPIMQFGQVYRTADGKYTATSIEELISKIREDDVEEKYLSEEEINKLKKLFEENDDSLDDEED